MSPRMPKHLVPQLTDEQRAWFRAQGKKYGHLGGITAAANMTPEARRARSKKGAIAAAKARAKKARQGRAGDQIPKVDKR
jgi:hypothetical protein